MQSATAMANRLWWWAKEPEEVSTPTSRPKPIELDVVELNVGGHIYTTTPQTLKSQPQSLLAELFAEDYLAKLDPEGRVFIDRSGEIFDEILEFLRLGDDWLPPDDSKDRKRLAAECRYYRLDVPQLKGGQGSCKEGSHYPVLLAYHKQVNANTGESKTDAKCFCYDLAWNGWGFMPNMEGILSQPHGTATLGDNMYVWGRGKGCFQRFDSRSFKWSALDDFPFKATYGMTGGVVDGHMLSLGYEQWDVPLVFRYKPEIDVWFAGPKMPVPTGSFSWYLRGMDYNNALVVMASYRVPVDSQRAPYEQQQPEEVVSSKMAKMLHPMLYDPRAGTWAELKSDSSPTPRHNFGATVLQDRVYMFGGTKSETTVSSPNSTRKETSSTKVVVDNVDAFDMRMLRWDCLGALPRRMSVARAITVDEDLYVVGVDNVDKDPVTMTKFSPLAATWQSVRSNLPAGTYSNMSLSLVPNHAT